MSNYPKNYLEDEYRNDPGAACKKALQMTRTIKDVDERLQAINNLLGMHGVEAIKMEGYQVDRYYYNIIALYANAGDTYDMTVVYDTEDKKWLTMSWGDYLEGWEMRHSGSKSDPTDRMMEDFLKLQYPGEADDFSIAEAIYWFANHYHGGQWTRLYSALSMSRFRPGAASRGPEPGSLAEMMYHDLAHEYAGEDYPEDEDEETEDRPAPPYQDPRQMQFKLNPAHKLKFKTSRDINGNKLLIVSNGRNSFSIQTLGNLWHTHNNGVEDYQTTYREMIEYVRRFGTRRQKQIAGLL